MGKHRKAALTTKTTPSGAIRYVVSLGMREGKRRIRSFDNRPDALAYLREVALADRKHGNRFNVLSERKRSDVMATLAEMEAAGTSLDEVWVGYKKHLLVERLTAKKALVRFMSHCIHQNLRPRYVEELEGTLSLFLRRHEETPLNLVRKPEVEAFLGRYKNPSTFRGLWGRLSSFFEYAITQEWIETNPVKLVTKPALDRNPPVILLPSDVSTVLNTAADVDPALLPYFLLGIYCGVRPQEILRLSTDDYRWKEDEETCGNLIIQSDVSKTRRRRIVKLPKVIEHWKDLAPGDSWYGIGEFVNLRRRLELVKERAGVKWSHDVMRHTAASMMVAHYHSAEKAALELGHSTQTLMTHYREILTEEECAQYLEIRPTTKQSLL